MDADPGAGKGSRRSVRSGLARGLIVMLAVVVTSGPAVGQLSDSRQPDLSLAAAGHRPETPGWVGRFTVLAFNAVLGGLTAGIRRHMDGGSFEDGFTRGFLGGTVVYAAKRVAVEETPGAGLAGRAIGGVGGSMIRNASESRPLFASLVVPVGPVRLHLERTSGTNVRLTRMKVDLNTVVMTGYAATRRELDFDLGASLSAGAPVFRADGYMFGEPADSVWAAGTVGESVIFLSELSWRTPTENSEVFAHERVHVLQRDQLFSTLVEPAGAAVARRVPGLPTLYRYVDFHFTGLIFGALSIPFDEYERRPWELEAFYLSTER